MPAGSSQTQTSCYRHPDRPAPISCTRCGRPICIDDAVDAPVGYLCPECAQQPKHVQRAQRRVAGAQSAQATTVLLAVIGLVYVAQLSMPELVLRGGLIGRGFAGDLGVIGVAEGEWWRVITSGFLHSQQLVLHVLFNGYLLYQLGKMLEPGVGTSRFLALFAGGLFGGSAGALLLSWGGLTIGASGAVFGLMGAAMVLLRRRGINPWRTSIGTLVILNLVFTFVASGVSIGGHVGGLIGGALVALPMTGGLDKADSTQAWGLVAALGALAVFAGVAGPLL